MALSVKDVCAIIRAASQHQVVELSFADLKLVFASRLPYSPLEKPRNHSVPEDPSVQTVFPEALTDAQIDGDHEMLEQIRLSQLMVSDPEGFESVMIDEQIHGQRVEPDEVAQDLGTERALQRS